MEEDSDDERREAAIASTPPLQPNFNPSGITQAQLTKFQVLPNPNLVLYFLEFRLLCSCQMKKLKDSLLCVYIRTYLINMCGICLMSELNLFSRLTFISSYNSLGT